MQKEKQVGWNKLSLVLKNQIHFCKICLKTFKNESIFDVFHRNNIICSTCSKKLNPHFVSFKIQGHKGLVIYKYDDEIKSLLYQVKGCYDIELAEVFLINYSLELSLLYKGYVVLPAPSYYKSEQQRGFNHLYEIFKLLRLPIYDVFEKTEDIKQSANSKKDRAKISNYIRLKNNVDLTNKKILLVDDVLTTGSTMNALINLVKEKNVKNIKVLLLSSNAFDST